MDQNSNPSKTNYPTFSEMFDGDATPAPELRRWASVGIGFFTVDAILWSFYIHTLGTPVHLFSDAPEHKIYQGNRHDYIIQTQASSILFWVQIIFAFLAVWITNTNNDGFHKFSSGVFFAVSLAKEISLAWRRRTLHRNEDPKFVVSVVYVLLMTAPLVIFLVHWSQNSQTQSKDHANRMGIAQYVYVGFITAAPALMIWDIHRDTPITKTDEMLEPLRKRSQSPQTRGTMSTKITSTPYTPSNRNFDVEGEEYLDNLLNTRPAPSRPKLKLKLNDNSPFSSGNSEGEAYLDKLLEIEMAKTPLNVDLESTDIFQKPSNFKKASTKPHRGPHRGSNNITHKAPNKNNNKKKTTKRA
ncbi:MAG: hypothetical protein ACTSUE_07740 [Promethearchaeota archaeon]